ncbi:MAG: acylneuraminate cytidylyltransferase family protein [Cyanobacteria bacterium]|nr:acylneuraminate cytidylyltransferase family protein [Cyanobacteriota bacterium]
MKVLGIITARGGSKGIPGKNLKLLAGRPLLDYSIDAANDTPLDRLILSTEDKRIADAARSLGCEVPFMRPAELARDETPHLPVIQHAVKWLKDNEGYQPDIALTLQPTSPLRSAADIAAALRMLELSGADSVVSVNEVSAHAHPMRMLHVDGSGFATLFVNGQPVKRRINRRQDLPRAWVMNGAIYACRTEILFAAEPSMYGDRVVAYPMPPERSISIDDLEDWAAAERAIAMRPPDHHHPST